MNICPKCGLPSEACVCEEIAKTQQEIEVKSEKRRFGKVTTIVSGIEGVDVKDVGKKLKAKLACGGTLKGKEIELQGEHRSRVKEILIDLGFDAEQIKVK
jgi:translation initiation factor 1